MAKEQTQPVEFLVQAKYRTITYPAGAEVDVLPDDVAGLIADGVIPADTEAAESGDKPLEKMTVPELREHADFLEIDLGDATKKSQILAVILAAQHPDEDEQPGGTPNGGAAGGNQ
ncbi:Rho termination factor N-terminal domain-containing protein [Cohnella sp. GCM10012308]|uniref:Rho termination factor N-terminal domain-containing protein n=1 Tax=Cohnella sp. GCM10012308 TaxID=3317329 RepID=UPI00360AE1FF